MNIKKYDVANGPGVRVSVFATGCHHHCKGCFNYEAWDFNAGREFTSEVIDEVLEAMDKSYISGLSLLGGEPFELVNIKGFLPLLRKVREKFPNKTIWSYTGYLFDKEILEDIYLKYDYVREFVGYLDIVVDGKFEEENKRLYLIFKGSSNQRIIDVKRTIESGRIILDPKNDEVLEYAKS